MTSFFATSHGKSPCDSIGGTAKRLPANASLQHSLTGQILTATDLFEFCDKNVMGIKFLFVSKDEIDSARPSLDDRFRKGQTIAGTRENYQFRPVNQSSIKVSHVSGEPLSITVSL